MPCLFWSLCSSMYSKQTFKEEIVMTLAELIETKFNPNAQAIIYTEKQELIYRGIVADIPYLLVAKHNLVYASVVNDIVCIIVQKA